MTHPRQIPITVSDDEWRNARDDDPTRAHLVGPNLVVNGLSMHVEAWRVETDERGVQSTVESAMAEDFGDLHAAVRADGHFSTTKIDGMEYIILATPFCS